MRFYISLLLAIFVCIGTEAKKVKLAKNIIYEGAVVNGTPSGEGVLTLEIVIHYSSGFKHITHYQVKGDFEGNTINNATFYEFRNTSTYWGDDRGDIKYSGLIKYAITKDDGKTMLVLQFGENGNTSAFYEVWRSWVQIKDYDKGSSLFTNTQKTVIAQPGKKGKIKYTKNTIYLGGVSGKTASGQGVLTVHSLKNKGNNLITVSGNFNDNVVHNAKLQIGKLTISASSLSYKISDYTKYADIIITTTKCKIQDFIETSNSMKIACRCDFKEKRAVFFEGNNSSASYEGTIHSDFQKKGLPSIVNAINLSDVVKQDISFKLQTINNDDAEEGLQVAVLGVKKLYFSSGMEVTCGSDCYFKYPNGDFIKTSKYGSLIACNYNLNGGNIQQYGSNIVIKYKNGDTFRAGNSSCIKISKDYLGQCSDINEITLVEGELIHTNKVAEKYENGQVVSTLYPLKDGGRYVVRKDMCNEIIYPDGYRFTASTPDGIACKKEYSPENSCSDYVPVNGDMVDNTGYKIELVNGDIVAKHIKDLHLMARNAHKRLFACDEDAHSLEHCAYNGATKTSKRQNIECLLNNDVVGYFDREGVKTDLQKRVLSQQTEYTSEYLPRMQKERELLFNDLFMVSTPLYHYDAFKFDVNINRYLFETSDTERETINSGYKEFHFKIGGYGGGLCLSYPRSLISLVEDGRYLIVKAQTCKVNDNDALKVENNRDKCRLVWVFRFEGIKNNKIYGKTTNLYLVNKETKEIYCDLSGSLSASHSSFKSKKVIVAPKEPKKVYHSRGRTENCPYCLGTGQGVKYMGESFHRPCAYCGGKGWYIEHYW